MADVAEIPLDERFFNDPRLVEFLGGLHTNTVLHYFAHSPFYDATSNNATLTTQANYNPSLLKYVETREAFEGQLRTMQGLEFVVAHEPPQAGAWVIRKQLRRKRSGLEDEITVLSTFFIVGETIYTGPSVGDVIGSRVLSTVTSLTKFLSLASTLPTFSPSGGYTYAAPASKTSNPPAGSQPSQASKESTPAPDGGPGPRGVVGGSTQSKSDQEARSLADSFSLALRFKGEYMDENPLVGEPGSFLLSSTRGHAQAPVPAPARAQARAPPVKKSAAPQAAQSTSTTSPTATTGRKASKGEIKSPASAGGPGKPKRKKSKVPNASASPT
ncbi:MAG: Mediator of RNA polymerase II transcription subunit 6 [Thelocarpon superellum]|nr:MAG: Mediator of RNA polymerase II transcription subunit 6 [Thelocarpon superellum]